MQLIMDLQKPSSRAGTPTLPSQAPRQPLYHTPQMAQWNPIQVALPRSPLTAYPVVTTPAPTPPPPATLAVPLTAAQAQLKRGLSVRSFDSTASEYSVASAPYDGQDRTYQPFNLGLATIPASPTTPNWPSSPGSYVWPKRQRASQIREELAPETYAKVRWRTDDDSVEPAASIPVAQAIPPAVRSLSSPTSSGALRINVPPPVHYRAETDSPVSVSTAQLYYTQASATSSSPTILDIPSRPPPRIPQRPY